MLKPAQRVDVVRETPCGNLCQKKDGTIGQCLTRADPPNLLTNVRSTRAPIGESCQHGRLRSQIKVRFEGHAEAWSRNIMRACRVRVSAYLEGAGEAKRALGQECWAQKVLGEGFFDGFFGLLFV